MIEIRNGIIRNAWLEIEDHNCLVCNVEVEGANWGVTFGNINLCGFTEKGRVNDTGYYIRRLTEIFLGGYGKLNSLIGKPCRVKIEDNSIIAIGHFLQETWFEPRIELNYTNDAEKRTDWKYQKTHTNKS